MVEIKAVKRDWEERWDIYKNGVLIVGGATSENYIPEETISL